MDRRNPRVLRVVEGAIQCLRELATSLRHRRHERGLPQNRRCASEALESRVLLTSAIVAAAAPTPVVISGTTNSDVFYVTYSGTTAAAVETVRISSGGAAPRLIGTYPITSPLAFSGLWGTDLVQITGTSGKDQFVVSGLGVRTNIAQITNDNIEGVELVGGGSDDIYAIDADTRLPKVFIDEAGGGVDTLDFSLTTTQGVFVDLRSTFHQAVNVNLVMQFKNPAALENIIGGSGNDTLIGNAAANVLVGGLGDDYLDGQAGNDIVIGGLGLDQLNGGANDDIVIAGRTTFDGNINALNELISEWKSTAVFSTRVARLRSGVGVSRSSLVAKSTVLNDTSPADRMYGGTGQDWFFRSREEFVTDQVFGEIFDIL